jgi:hypothetical protein
MSRTVQRRALICVVFAALAFSSTAAAVPFPLQREGKGTEPLSGAGVFAGRTFRPTTAFVRWDPHLRVLDLLLFTGRSAPHACGSVAQAAARASRLVEIGLSHQAKRLLVGRPLAGPIVEFVSHGATGAPRVEALQHGVRLILTRVDTARGGVWHGRLSVHSTRIAGGRYGYAGTFSAGWCSR